MNLSENVAPLPAPKRSCTPTKRKNLSAPPQKRRRHDDTSKRGQVKKKKRTNRKCNKVKRVSNSKALAVRSRGKQATHRTNKQPDGKRHGGKPARRLSSGKAIIHHSKIKTGENSTSGHLGCMENNSTSAGEKKYGSVPDHLINSSQVEVKENGLPSPQTPSQQRQLQENCTGHSLKVPAIVKYFVRNHMHKDCSPGNHHKKNTKDACRCLGDTTFGSNLSPATSSQAPTSDLITDSMLLTDASPLFVGSFRANIPSEIASIVRFATSSVRHLCRIRASRRVPGSQTSDQTVLDNSQNVLD
ncbi:unnamed protein product [Dicrocoelium dendriticum]|nr:unnamed protein product [Dicrocoelium dendriticum]